MKLPDGIEIPMKLGVTTETARVCHNLLDLYYGTHIRVVDLDVLVDRLFNLIKQYGSITEDVSRICVKQELEQVCMIPWEGKTDENNRGN